MPKYTFDEFEKAAQAQGWGLGNGFSEADWKLAQENPDAGMSILNYKIDYNNSTTAEGRALANEGANRVRSSYGNYSGGTDGGKYYLEALAPMDYQQKEAPTWEDAYGDTYKNALDGVLNFQYDPSTDPLYSQYRKQYTREGRRATEDTLGAAAAASGGIPSSYAATAAAQAGNYYRAQMTDKIPELAQIQYNQRLQGWNSARNARQDDYNIYLNALGQYNTDRNFDFGVFSDEIADQRYGRNEAWQNALNAWQYGGDPTWLNKLGVNTDNNPIDWERNYTLAQLGAQYGDPSGLKALGINPDALALYNFNQLASKGYIGSGGGGSGGYSGSGGSGSYGGSTGSGGSGGESSSGTPQKWTFTLANQVREAAGGNTLSAEVWDTIKNTYGVSDADIAQYGFTRVDPNSAIQGADSALKLHDWEGKYR